MAQIYLDFTKGGKVSLTKALVSALAGTVQKTGFELYCDYFRKYTLLDPDYNLSALSRFSEQEQISTLDNLFHQSDRSKDPDWLSFWSAHDVNRLSDLLDAQTVIYTTRVNKDQQVPRLMTGKWIKSNMHGIEIYHDYRSASFGRSVTDNSQNAARFEGDTRSRNFYFLLVIQGNERRLYFLESGDTMAQWMDQQFCVVGMPFERLRSAVLPSDGGCEDFLDSVCLLLGSEFINAPNPRLRIETANDFLYVSEDEVYHHLNARITGGLAKPFLIVTFTRNTGRVPFKRQMAKSKSRQRALFTTLAVISKVPCTRPFSERVPDAANCDVVCIYGRFNVGLLAEDWRRAVVANHFSTRGCKEKLQNRHLTGLDNLSKKVSAADLQEALAKVETARRGSDRPKKCLRKKCRCEHCHQNSDYDRNMSKIGPERLCSTHYTISELVKILNIDVEDNVLDAIVELSVAAMDIESKTEAVCLVSPRPGPSVDYAEVDQAILEGHTKKVQTPIMIAHTDALTVDSTWSLTAEGDAPADTFKLMADYWSRLIDRREHCLAKKRELAQPIMDVLSEYSQAFVAAYMSHVQECRTKAMDAHQEALDELEACHEGTDAELAILRDGLKRQFSELLDRLPDARGCHRAWRSTLPGILHHRLTNLIQAYTVFSFCG